MIKGKKTHKHCRHELPLLEPHNPLLEIVQCFLLYSMVVDHTWVGFLKLRLTTKLIFTHSWHLSKILSRAHWRLDFSLKTIVHVKERNWWLFINQFFSGIAQWSFEVSHHKTYFSFALKCPAILVWPGWNWAGWVKWRGKVKIPQTF